MGFLTSIVYCFALLKVFASAQTLDPIPACAQSCFGNLGGCSSIDINCICKNAGLIQDISCCSLAACSQQDFEATVAYAKTLCATSGVTINGNPSCATASSAATSLSTQRSSSVFQSSLTSTSASSSPTSSNTSSREPGGGNGTSTASTTSQKGGLSTGAKVGIGVGVPIAFFILLALLFLILRTRKKSAKAGIEQQGTASATLGEDQATHSGLILADEKGDIHHTMPPELHSTNIASPPAAMPFMQHNQHPVLHEVDAGTAGAMYPQPYHQQPGYQNRSVSEMGTTTMSPMRPTELSDNHRWAHPQELHNQNDWSQTHEMGIPSRAMSTISDGNTLAGDPNDRDEYLEELKAKRAQVAEERERLRRMEMLREEDERLEREIEEYERRRGIL